MLRNRESLCDSTRLVRWESRGAEANEEVTRKETEKKKETHKNENEKKSYVSIKIFIVIM